MNFDRDTTTRWASRGGDYVLWGRSRGLVAPPDQAYSLADIWELRDGDFVTLTNRVADLPGGFDLHPFEVSGSLVPWMFKRINEGYNPTERVDGPSLWRVRTGDRVAWVGAPRSGVSSEGDALQVVTFRVDALVYGEPITFTAGCPTFGSVSDAQSVQGQRLCSAGMVAILRDGVPRTLAADPQWCLG